jgi:spore germination cell wall hydrolase CwlJ-like protein
MVTSGFGPKEAFLASCGLGTLVFLLTPSAIGFQDLGSLMARQPEVAARWHQHLIASPFGTIHAATFSFSQPIGTAMPEPASYRLASLETEAPSVAGSMSIGRPFAHRVRPTAVEPIAFPSVNRSGKGDRLVPSARPQPFAERGPSLDLRPIDEPELHDVQRDVEEAIQRDAAGDARPSAAPGTHVDEIEAAVRFEPFPEYDISLSLELHPIVPQDGVTDLGNGEAVGPDMSILESAADPDATERTARLFFGDGMTESASRGIERWAPGEEPVVMAPRTPMDADIKQSALAPATDEVDAKPDAPSEGVTVAGKGEVTGEGRRPRSPAERLGLTGKARDKAEKCLANAVYFESRGEAMRGQIAVAQVVMNRVFSGYYPGDVCGVVYQNAHRHLACQFTFACDGIRDVVTEPEGFERAKRIAGATLDGTIWLPEVGKATHYHAYWVHPWWVRTMRKLSRIGVHTFYRPHRWGDGADKPSWGSAQNAAEAAAKL